MSLVQKHKVRFYLQYPLFVLLMHLPNDISVAHTIILFYKTYVGMASPSPRRTASIVVGTDAYNSQTGGLKMFVVSFVGLDTLLNVRKFLLLAQNVNPSQLGHLQKVALQVLFAEINLYLFNDKLGVIKFFCHPFASSVLPSEQHVLV